VGAYLLRLRLLSGAPCRQGRLRRFSPKAQTKARLANAEAVHVSGGFRSKLQPAGMATASDDYGWLSITALGDKGRPFCGTACVAPRQLSPRGQSVGRAALPGEDLRQAADPQVAELLSVGLWTLAGQSWTSQ